MEREPRYREREDDEELERRERYARPGYYRGPLQHARDWRDVEPYGWAGGPRYGERGYGERGYGERGYDDWDERERAARGHHMGRARDESWFEPEPRVREESEHALADRIAQGIRSFFRRDRDRDRNRDRGPHRGKGPRGYRRSDERIREDVCEAIAETGWVDASDVEVRVHDGEVTLAGTVLSRRDKRLLEDLAEEAPGVIDVHNQIRVRRDEPREAAPAYRHGPG